MRTDDPELFKRFADETGVEIFQLLVTRSENLGVQKFEDILGALTGAIAVCLANVLRPAVEAVPNRATVADNLIAVCAKHARRLLNPVITGAD